MQNELKNHIDKLDKGEFPSFLDVMSALSQVAETMTLDERPSADAETITICELNGHVCCGD